MASTAINVQLLGPPELHQQPIPQGNDDANTDNSPSSPSFMDLMVSDFNNIRDNPIPRPPMGFFTENFSPTFLSSGNPCLDFFFHVVPDTPPEAVSQRLELAWKHNPLTTLKLVCNLRGVRGTGKSDKEGFYASALWLHKHHPKTLACNVKWFAEFGYFKDLPEILFRVLEGLDIRKTLKRERLTRKGSRGAGRGRGRGYRGGFREPYPGIGFQGPFNMFGRGSASDEEDKSAKKRRRQRSRFSREERVSAEKKQAALEKEKARNLKKEKNVAKGSKALERYKRDPDYRFLHDRISEVFAEYLSADLKFLNSGEIRKISLASKWCPNLDSSFDRSTLLCESIARRLFPRHSDPEYEGIEEAHYAYRIRDRLRKEVLVPLRQTLELPEVYMSFKKWDSLPYNRVASVAMKNYKKTFMKHDEERFKEYLESVKRGETTIAAGALLPHEIIASLTEEAGEDVAELQWRRMVEDLSEKGTLTDCLAVCDVSGSMNGTPMEVCIALGLLISELSEDPWKGKVITFHHNPKLHIIKGNSLRAKRTNVSMMEWGGNTNFQKVFDLILQVAVNGKLSKDKMIKKLFVFSDMEFDQASANHWETDYEVIKRKYRENGYESSVPEIVFWNLRDSMSTPVTGDQKGVALVSGFSKNLVTLFLEGMDSDKLKPEYVMEKAISGEEYKQLVVLD